MQAAATLGDPSLTLDRLRLLVPTKLQSTVVFDQANYTKAYTAWHYLHRKREIGKYPSFFLSGSGSKLSIWGKRAMFCPMIGSHCGYSVVNQ